MERADIYATPSDQDLAYRVHIGWLTFADARRPLPRATAFEVYADAWVDLIEEMTALGRRDGTIWAG